MPRKRVLFMMDDYVPRIHQGVVWYAQKTGWILDAGMARTRKPPEHWHCDGIIVFDGMRPELQAVIRQAAVPVIELFGGAVYPGSAQVLFDHESIGRMAAEYLVPKGFKHIGFVDTNAHDLTHSQHAVERIRGMRQVTEAAGRSFFTVSLTQLPKLAATLPKPFAIMGHTDYVAERAMQRLMEAGFRIPLDVAVIGADNDPLFHGVAPVPLSSIVDNGESVGYRAAEILDDMMKGKPAPTSPVLIQPARVVERESTNILAISHPPTAKALRLLKEHYTEPVDLDAIALQAGMCRRRLEDYFLKLVGHSMSGELLRLRIGEARQLLTGSDCKISEVAQKVGFANVAHFATRFRKTVGRKPSACRPAGMPTASPNADNPPCKAGPKDRSGR